MSESEKLVTETVREELESKKPSVDERKELRSKHVGHLVRKTTSQLSMDSVEVTEGFEMTTTAEMPDIYCFTCEEWIGMSGVELRGRPRSRKDAYYLGGIPEDVARAREGTQKTLEELADALVERVSMIENRDDAFEFIKTELEQNHD